MFGKLIKAVGFAAKFVSGHKVELLLGATMAISVTASIAHDVKIDRKIREYYPPEWHVSMSKSLKDRAEWIAARIATSSTMRGIKTWLKFGVVWHALYLLLFCRYGVNRPISFLASESWVIDEIGVLRTLIKHAQFIIFWPIYGTGWSYQIAR